MTGMSDITIQIDIAEHAFHRLAPFSDILGARTLVARSSRRVYAIMILTWYRYLDI